VEGAYAQIANKWVSRHAIEARMSGERLPAAVWMFRAFGASVAIAVMELLAALAGEPLARVPFVTSIVLVMALPSSEAAGPRAIVGGHLLSAISGFACLWLLGPGEAASAAGVGLATFGMIAFRAIHPPAGIGAFLVPLYQLPASWLLSPVLAGALLLTVYAKLWRKAERWLITRGVM
jgi:CBS-domain-containing membrane protein